MRGNTSHIMSIIRAPRMDAALRVLFSVVSMPEQMRQKLKRSQERLHPAQTKKSTATQREWGEERVRRQVGVEFRDGREMDVSSTVHEVAQRQKAAKEAENECHFVDCREGRVLRAWRDMESVRQKRLTC